MDMVTGADIWDINAAESVAYQYSRFNYNVDAVLRRARCRSRPPTTTPRSSGLDATSAARRTEVQILATNDFHGRLLPNGSNAEAGAAVSRARSSSCGRRTRNTVFAAAGDLIGASTFESFIQEDKPTIDALNEAGLEVSAVGNHEFDKGYDDLVNRVMAEYDETDNPRGGAEWQYIGANVERARRCGPDPADLDPDFGGVEVGFVGAVTEDLAELVSRGASQGLTVTDIVDATNDAADDLKAGGADIVVLLVHEGAPNTNCATMDDDPTSDFGSIITGRQRRTSTRSCRATRTWPTTARFPVRGMGGDVPVTERPVVSAGQYGTNLNQLVFTVDDAGDVRVSTRRSNLESCTANCTPPATGLHRELPVRPGYRRRSSRTRWTRPPCSAQCRSVRSTAPSTGRKLADGTTENRGAESTLGNLVAEVQRWATETPEAGSAEIAFMNPGGLRADMAGDGTTVTYPRTVTYRQAANVQPFANTLVNMRADRRPDQAGARAAVAATVGASRPFLRLGVSEGFTYTYRPGEARRAPGSRACG